MSDDITIIDLVIDIICATFGVVVLNIYYQNIVELIFDLALKIG